MATFLYRIGRFMYRHRFLTIAVWMVLLLGAGASTALAKPFVTEFSSLPGTESERASNMLSEKFPQQADMNQLASGTVVVKAPSGSQLSDPDTSARIDSLISALRGVPHVAQPEAIVNPVTHPGPMAQVSRDGTIASLDVVFDQQFADIEQHTRDAFIDALQEGRDAGLTVEATGMVLSGAPPQQGASELIGFGVALIVMVIAFASVAAATLPIITALFGVGIAIASITGATAVLTMDSSALMTSTMLGIAVAIDYAMFIVSRFRSELNFTHDRAHAAGRAVGTAGSSVVFAGLTVVIALVGLAVVDIPMISVMGYAAAFAVVVAVLVALTLLPAFLGLFGSRAFALRIPGLRRGSEPDSMPSNGLRWVRVVVAHPIPVLLAAVLLLGAIAVPVTKLELGFDLATGDQKKAVQLLNEGFGEGATGPLMVVVDGDGAPDPQRAYTELAEAIRVSDGVQMVAPAQTNPDSSGALIMVIPKTGPNSAATRDLMHHIRDLGPALRAQTGAQFGVTGQTAIIADLSAALLQSLLPYLALVVGLAFLVLMVVFRSLLVPLTAALGFLLSIGATFGATVAIFQEGWFGVIKDPGPLISFLPIFLIGVVFGLAMDYQVFLVTRMREEYIHGPGGREGARAAVVAGFQHGARVVTSAAVIMIAVFAAFILMPDTMAKAMGFALAAAVFFDAVVVRMAVIPAVMGLLGEKAWYLPRWLDRLLPNVDVEGERLKQMAAEPPPPASPHLVPARNGMQRVLVVADSGGSGRHRL
jgi:RND superfamily putative drug exporter